MAKCWKPADPNEPACVLSRVGWFTTCLTPGRVHHDEADRVNQLLIDFFAPALPAGN
jgi:hypothetical protein